MEGCIFKCLVVELCMSCEFDGYGFFDIEIWVICFDSGCGDVFVIGEQFDICWGMFV